MSAFRSVILIGALKDREGPLTIINLNPFSHSTTVSCLIILSSPLCRWTSRVWYYYMDKLRFISRSTV